MTNINEGQTNNYLVHGVFTLIGGALLIFIHFTLFIPFILIAIALFMSSNGIILDGKKKATMLYSDFFGYKYGKWNKYENIIHAKLILSIERAITNQAMIMGDRGTSKSMTYDIILTNEFGEDILLYEFLKYSKAQKALVAINKEFNTPIVDKVAEKLMQNRKHPRR